MSPPEGWERPLWGIPNWNAYVVSGATREERASRLAECPAEWRAIVKAHVVCAFKVREEARKRRERKAREEAKGLKVPRPVARPA